MAPRLTRQSPHWDQGEARLPLGFFLCPLALQVSLGAFLLAFEILSWTLLLEATKTFPQTEIHLSPCIRAQASKLGRRFPKQSESRMFSRQAGWLQLVACGWCTSQARHHPFSAALRWTRTLALRAPLLYHHPTGKTGVLL